ncbi:hypothetical protein JCM11251_006244 [Rhodosporidiobolus azoricus]
MSSAYVPPSTPPRSRGARSTSVSAGSSFSSVNGLFSRASPRTRLRAANAKEKTMFNKAYRDGQGPAKKRDRLKSRVKRLRDALLARWRAGAFFLLLLGTLLYWALPGPERPPLIIPKRPYTLQTYRHLDFSTPISLRPATRVLHVTKEFGPATMGGLGAMLTALSIAQSESPYLSISVALPHYSYLHERFTADEIHHFADLSIPVTLNPTSPSRARTSYVRCPVSLLRWRYSAASDFLNPDADFDSSASTSANSSLSRTIDVYLLGPSNIKPFSAAFRAKDEGDIYSAYKPLKQEWKDLYFARAAAELVAYLGAKDEATVFEDDELGALEAELEEEDEIARGNTAKRRVDVVHLHGATNAMVAHFLREREREHRREEPHSRHPAIVYTLHDSLDEVEYSNLVENTVHFLPPAPSPASPALMSSLSRLEPYIYRSSTQLFTSALGIDLADAVTFVSRSIASDIVSGRFRFHLEGLVMPSISKRAAEGAFFGVTNGLDFTERSKNPFTAPSLRVRGLAFPRVGADIIDEWSFHDEVGRPVSFAETKQRVKEYLISQLPAVFTHSDDATRPWFLFIGRYQYNKGCQFFSTLLDVLSSDSLSHPQGRLILLGARNNYPFSALQSFAKQFPHHLTLIDDVATPGFQSKWGTFLRMASDFAVVPSLSEAFGLVAAEGLLFGSPVLSTGVGGLREFLVPFPSRPSEAKEGRTGNSYLFDLFPTIPSTVDTQGAEADYSQAAHDVRPDEEQLKAARAELRRETERALRDWKARREASWVERERFVRKMVADALELKWNRERGPVEEYIRVYDVALSNRRRRLGLPRFIPPPSSIRDDEHPSFSPQLSPNTARPLPPPFIAHPLRQVLQHPMAVPHIKQGGHDRVSGSDGLANLLVQRAANLAQQHNADELPHGGVDRYDQVDDARSSQLDGGGGTGNTLPIVKIWAANEDPKTKAKEAAARALYARKKDEKRRAQQAAKAAAKRRGVDGPGRAAVLRKTLEKVARRKKKG